MIILTGRTKVSDFSAENLIQNYSSRISRVSQTLVWPVKRIPPVGHAHEKNHPAISYSVF